MSPTTALLLLTSMAGAPQHGKLVYSLDITDAKRAGVEEVLVDAVTGRVVSATHESAAAEGKEQSSEATPPREAGRLGEVRRRDSP